MNVTTEMRTRAAARAHVIGPLIFSPEPAARALRLAIILVGIVLGLRSLHGVLATLVPPLIYRKDFLAMYVLARAIAEDFEPYVSLDVLVDRYLLVPDASGFPHPSPHPPTLGALLMPLSQLDYSTAALVWSCLQIVGLATSVFLLARGTRVSLGAVLALTVVLVAWSPVRTDLLYGQVMIALMLLLVGMRAALRAGHPFLGGGLLGATLLVKPIAWPVALALVLRREWRAVAGTAIIFSSGSFVAAGLIGVERMIVYYSRVLPSVTAIYQAYWPNLSLWTVGWRVFQGTHWQIFDGTTMPGTFAPPLLEWPLGARLVSVGVPLVVLLVACACVRRMRHTDLTLGLMVCVSIAVSPITWGHYFVLAAIPMTQVMEWLGRHGLPPSKTNVSLLLGTLLIVPDFTWANVAFLVAGQMPAAGSVGTLPLGPSLLVLIPVVAVAVLGCFLVVLDGGLPWRESRSHKNVVGTIGRQRA